ncbi:MAG: hypothetical protein HWN68_12805 [Desulfobacterales bacterium]|nr:hypothetical protein [Desulfobacterales bacterium]
MVRVKSETDIKANYEKSTGDVGRRFEIGVKTAEWKEPSIAGQELYEIQMSNSEVLARRKTGIDRVSDAEWRDSTITKGKTIIGDRMKKASGKQIARYRPYRTLIEGITLPPKTASVEENISNRCVPIAVAQHELKKEIG